MPHRVSPVAKSNEKRSDAIPQNVYKPQARELHAFSSVRTGNTVCDFPCMNEAVKFQMWAVQLAFSPNVNECFWANRPLLFNRSYRVRANARSRVSWRPADSGEKIDGF